MQEYMNWNMTGFRVVWIYLNYQYVEVGTVQGELPKCDLVWPKGAPNSEYVKVDDRIFKKKVW